MKTKLTTLALSLISVFAFCHGGVELGPNSGRILEFSKDETMHGEVTVKGDQFHIAVLDKDMKQVVMKDQSLTAVTGDRNAPTKLTVTKDDKGFLVPLVKEGDWLIVQFKLTPNTKAITARMEFITKQCGECRNPEWLCICKAEEGKK